MSPSFQELDYQQTPLGELILRQRRSPSLDGQTVYEVKLNGEFLMSSVVTNSEEALATLAIDAWGERPCEVLVGGLGLGYTADAILRSDQVRRVDVIELLEPVIEWHQRGLLPVSDTLLNDARCALVHADFFRQIAAATATPKRRYDLILLDIDHSPDAWLHPSHEAFYTDAGLKQLVNSLSPQGVFGLWSAEATSESFLQRLRSVFSRVEQHPITYHHPMLHRQETNAVVIARDPIS